MRYQKLSISIIVRYRQEYLKVQRDRERMEREQRAQQVRVASLFPECCCCFGGSGSSGISSCGGVVFPRLILRYCIFMGMGIVTCVCLYVCACSSTCSEWRRRTSGAARPRRWFSCWRTRRRTSSLDSSARRTYSNRFHSCPVIIV